MRSRVARWIAIAAVLCLIIGCSRNAQSDVWAWKAASHDATALTLIVITFPDDSVLKGELVSESDTRVVVAAVVHLSGGSQTANGVFREVDIELKSPIGDREVVNRDGRSVPEQ